MIVLKTPSNLRVGEIIKDISYEKYEKQTIKKILRKHSQILVVNITASLWQNESINEWGTYLDKDYYTARDIKLDCYFVLYHNDQHPLILIPTDRVFHYYITGYANLYKL